MKVSNDQDWFKAAVCGDLVALQQNVNMYKGKKAAMGWTALIYAANKGHQQCVQFLAPYEMGMKMDNGYSALMIVAMKNHPDCIQYLQQELKMKSMDRKTALVIAIEQQNVECVKLLVEECDVLCNN